MKRQRRIASGQGWLTLPHGLGQRLLASITSDQPETILGGAGLVRIHRLPPFPPKPEVERTNVSGEVSVAPVGAVRAAKRKPARIEPAVLSASGAHILTPREGKIANDTLSRGDDPWLAVALLRVIGGAGDDGVDERDLIALAEAEVVRMSLGRLMAEGKLIESWNGSDFEYREP